MINFNTIKATIFLVTFRNRGILVSAIAATFAGAITMLAHIGQFAMIFGGRSDDEEHGSSGVASLYWSSP